MQAKTEDEQNSVVEITEQGYEIFKLASGEWNFVKFWSEKENDIDLNRTLTNGWGWAGPIQYAHVWEFSKNEMGKYFPSHFLLASFKRRRISRTRTQHMLAISKMDLLGTPIQCLTINSGLKNTQAASSYHCVVVPSEIADLSKKANFVQILVVGVCGSGKSTLINAVFDKKIAETGDGAPVTKGFNKYQLNENVTIIDFEYLHLF